MKIEDYFFALERSLTQNVKVGSVQQPILCLASDEYNGLVRCRIFFWDDSYLDLYEVVSTEKGYPTKVHYAYTYMRNEQRIFRYDNAPHHPQIDAFPHHKHVGPKDKLGPSEEPSLTHVLQEIEGYLQSD